ncbi:lasso RiPP family leader peptide-containing protein [Streptomyces sp. NPDC017529]
MQEPLEETEYETPELAEAGGFAVLTQGHAGIYWDGYSGFFGSP